LEEEEEEEQSIRNVHDQEGARVVEEEGER